MSSDKLSQTNAEARFNKSLRPWKPEGSLGRTAQDVHLDSHTAPELCRAVRSVTSTDEAGTTQSSQCVGQINGPGQFQGVTDWEKTDVSFLQNGNWTAASNQQSVTPCHAITAGQRGDFHDEARVGPLLPFTGNVGQSGSPWDSPGPSCGMAALKQELLTVSIQYPRRSGRHLRGPVSSAPGSREVSIASTKTPRRQ